MVFQIVPEYNRPIIIDLKFNFGNDARKPIPFLCCTLSCVPGALTRNISATLLYRSMLKDSNPVMRTMRTGLLPEAATPRPDGEAAAATAASAASAARILRGT